MTGNANSDLPEDQDLISRLLITAHKLIPEADVIDAMRSVLADLQADTVKRADDVTPTNKEMKP